MSFILALSKRQMHLAFCYLEKHDFSVSGQGQGDLSVLPTVLQVAKAYGGIGNLNVHKAL